MKLRLFNREDLVEELMPQSLVANEAVTPCLAGLDHAQLCEDQGATYVFGHQGQAVQRKVSHEPLSPEMILLIKARVILINHDSAPG